MNIKLTEQFSNDLQKIKKLFEASTRISISDIESYNLPDIEGWTDHLNSRSYRDKEMTGFKGLPWDEHDDVIEEFLNEIYEERKETTNPNKDRIEDLKDIVRQLRKRKLLKFKQFNNLNN